jgi:uncharacterized phage protein (TIGR02220 family)
MAVRAEGKLLETETDVAIRLIQFLNKQTGRNYRATRTNQNGIVSILREGYTEQECRQVIAMKVREWHGQTWHSIDGRVRRADDYLNPITLFRSQNFNRYAGMLI